jgi:hypothetical protein
LTALGTQQVLYFRRVPNGLMSNNGEAYFNAAGLAELSRQEEIARQQQIATEAAAAAAATAARAENQRQQAIAAEHEAEQRRVADVLAQQNAEANRRATVIALESSECTQGEYTVASRSELVFTVSVQRECWTPWLVPKNPYDWGVKESGDVLLQKAFADGTMGKEYEDGPGKTSNSNQLVRAVRFKSLKKEPVRITFADN